MNRSILALVIFAGASLPPAAHAFDQRMIGAWSQSTSDCASMFQRSGDKIVFKKPVDEFKTAFIITQNNIVSPTQQCSIRKVSQQKEFTSVSMTCSNTIGYFDREAQIKIEDKVLTYGFPGEGTLDVRFEKCPM